MEALPFTRSSFCALAACVAAFLPSLLHADITLSWDPDSDSSVVGYRLYSGTTSGVYTQTSEAGAATSLLVSNLTPGKTYYFAVTGYNSSAVESSFSNQVSYTVPSSSPTPTPSPTATPSPSPSVSPSPTPSPSPTASVTPSPSATPSPSVSPTPSPNPTPSPSASPFATPTPSVSPTPSPSPGATVTPTPTASPSPGATISPTPAATPSHVQGAGIINGPNGDQVRFNINVQAQKIRSRSRITGSFSCNDATGTFSVSTARITSLTFNGNQAQFITTAKIGRARVTFTITGTDNSQAGTPDTFSIQGTNGLSISGTVTNGEIIIN